jgi:acyl carrier protein
MTRDEIRNVTLEVLGQIAPEADLEGLDPAKSFRDQFELDSVDYLNFVLTLQQRLDIQIPEMECPRLSSLNGSVDYLADKIGVGRDT